MKKVKLVSVSFPGRDLSLALLSLKGFAMKDKEVASKVLLSVSQFDLNTPKEEILQELSKSKSDMYCFSVYVWNFHKVMHIAGKLKEQNPKLKIILGGPEVSGMAEKVIRKYEFVDIVFVGDGEIAFREFLKSGNISQVPNAVYRKNGSIVCNPVKALESFDELVLHHESKDYKDYLEKSPTKVRAAIETSRGCPFRCGYCSWGGQKIRYFDLEKIKPALKFLLEHPKVSLVYITDSNPFLKKDRAKELLDFIIKHNMHKKPMVFELNPDYVKNDDILRRIAQLSNDEFAFGVQSTSVEVLSKINRPFDAERYKRNIQLIRKTNPKVKIWFSLILGLPSDDYEKFLESVDFVLNLQPDGIYFHELLCLPGSDFYNNPEKYGIEFMEEAPHKILKNKTFPKKDYNKAKKLSYYIYLIHRIPELRNNLLELHKNQPETRLVDIYKMFFEFLDGKIDISGKRIEDVSSWFFEQHANEFLNNEQNSQQLETIYYQFEKGVKNGKLPQARVVC